MSINTQLSGGFAGLQFVDDIIYLLENSWVTDNGGTKPVISKLWETKEVGMADTKYRTILVNIDSENPQIYSMLQGNNGSLASNYDWLHDVSITLDIRTGQSEDAVLQMVSEVMRILKTNVVPIINTNQYIQLLPEGITSMNADYNNMFRYLISVSGLKFNP